MILSCLLASAGCGQRTRATWGAPAGAVAAPPERPATTPSASAEAVPTPAPAPANLPVVSYDPAPAGFPDDPGAMSTDRAREGLRPTGLVAAYDAPGGRPRAFLAPTLAGVELTVPIVQRRPGWVAVMLPSSNRRLAWVPADAAWTAVPLRDQLVVYRGNHTMQWYRDDKLVRSWRVSLGVRATPTPLGRTFILGRSSLPGAVYANTDVFALGSIPEDPSALPTALRGAHIGIHTWHNDNTIGQNSTDGCVRLTKSGQELLLAELVPGTPVVVLDTASPA
jgi:hypothetical protein